MIHMLIVMYAVFGGVATDEPSNSSKHNMLSDVLPESLAAFVKAFDHDRQLDSVLRADALQLVSTAKVIDSDLAKSVLMPELVKKSDGRAFFKKATTDDPDEENTRLVLVAATPVLLDSGRALKTGDPVPAGETVRFGLVLNGGGIPAEAVGPGGSIHIVVQPGQGVLFPCDNTCTIKCPSNGTYACAYLESVFECAQCECLDNTELDGSCIAGGMGATGCSITR